MADLAKTLGKEGGKEGGERKDPGPYPRPNLIIFSLETLSPCTSLLRDKSVVLGSHFFPEES